MTPQQHIDHALYRAPEGSAPGGVARERGARPPPAPRPAPLAAPHGTCMVRGRRLLHCLRGRRDAPGDRPRARAPAEALPDAWWPQVSALGPLSLSGREVAALQPRPDPLVRWRPPFPGDRGHRAVPRLPAAPRRGARPIGGMTLDQHI